jgi:hypothetical protein
MTDKDPFVTAGEDQGEIVAAYLIDRMKQGKLTPTEAVNIVAAHIEQQAEALVAAGTEPDHILAWLKGLRETVSARITAFTEPQH